MNLLTSYKYLKIGFFNINGQVGETTYAPDFSTLIEKYDIVTLTETWHKDAECIKKIKKNVPKNYRFFENARKKQHKKSKRNSGGILVCYKKTLIKHLTVIDKTSENMIWIKLKKDYLNTNQNLIIGGV